MALSGRAIKASDAAVVAQRIKKLSSIEVKLQRNPKMQLSQMQDIGGCRAILPNIEDVDALVAIHRASEGKNASRSGLARDPYDYVLTPKLDGYRGVHLIYKYRSAAPDYQVYNGQRIEIQIRSHLQHSWATAVEVFDTISHEGIKVGRGSEEWRRFFALMSSAMAIREQRPQVPGTPPATEDLYSELRALSSKLHVDSRLRSYATSVASDEHVGAAQVFLLTLDLKAEYVTIRGFGKKELAEANAALFAAEKERADDPNYNSVLVGMDKLKNLRAAYPNYYLDTDEFLRFLDEITNRS